MPEFLREIISVDLFTVLVVGVLSTWAGIIIRHMSESTFLALIFTPAIGFGALTGIYACRELEIVFSTNQNSNLITSLSIGMIVAMFIMLLVTRIWLSMTTWRRTGLGNRMDPTLDGSRTIGSGR